MPRTREVTNSDDIIDSRDVIARIEELQDERDAHGDFGDDLNAQENNWRKENPDNAAELDALNALQAEAEGYSDWKYGAALIRDSYFKKYAQQLADDMGAIDANANWPMSCIDWDQAARELQIDYTSVEFDGVTYWMR